MTAEAFEEVAPGDIEQALERQRAQGENGGGAVVNVLSVLSWLTLPLAPADATLAVIEALDTPPGADRFLAPEITTATELVKSGAVVRAAESITGALA